jgi:hypothetical protein
MDRELVQLKKKYAENSTIVQILNQFDPGIETNDIIETPAPALRSKNSRLNMLTQRRKEQLE